MTSHQTSAGTVSTDDWQRALLEARQLFRGDLHRVPSDQVASYVAHVAARVRLPIDDVTAAATEAVTSDPTTGW